MTQSRQKQGWRRWIPETYMGFPVDESAVNGRALDIEGRANVEANSGKRGIALVIAIMIISVMMLFTSDLILSSQVNISLATNGRDSVKAEYMAKSGMNLSLLLLTADLAYDLYQAKIAPKGAALSDGLGDLWAAMNGLPIGGETLEMMSQFQENFDVSAVMDSKVLDQLKLFDGAFVIDVKDESQKINLNLCGTSRCLETMAMLELLFACPAEKAFLDEKKLSGRELSYRIKDWIDQDSRAEEASGFNDENEPYNKRDPKLAAKNAQMDSLEELRLIEGWDEEVHAVFSPYLTVFPYQVQTNDTKFKMNINTMSRSLLQCLLPEVKGDCQEKTALALSKRNADGTNLVTAGQTIEQVLKEALCYQGQDGSEQGASNRANWFTQSSNVFRIESQGNVGDSVKKLVAIIERTMPNPKDNEKSAFKIRYLRVM